MTIGRLARCKHLCITVCALQLIANTSPDNNVIGVRHGHAHEALLRILSLWGGCALALDLLWRAVLARVDKVLRMRRGLKYVLLLRRPSNLGKLTAKLKRLITTNRLELTTRTD